jgi:hypothetical protein
MMFRFDPPPGNYSSWPAFFLGPECSSRKLRVYLILPSRPTVAVTTESNWEAKEPPLRKPTERRRLLDLKSYSGCNAFVPKLKCTFFD